MMPESLFYRKKSQLFTEPFYDFMKKDLVELLPQGLNLIFGFAYWLLNGFTHSQQLRRSYSPLIAACAER